jgi:hypothetical protein
MTIYTVTKSDSNGLTVTYEDGSWAVLPVTVDMLPEDIDDLAAQFAPKNLQAPAFISVGTQRSAVEKPAEERVEITPETFIDDRPQWLKDRVEAYGSIGSQIEYITENGLEAWQAHVAEIKAANPKL